MTKTAQFFSACCLTLAALTPASAQTGSPLIEAILPRYETAKRNLVEAAEVMPAGDYGYRLTPPQRSFAGWIEHTASMNYGQCSLMLGKAAPAQAVPEEKAGKADLAQALRKSFEYCDEAFRGMSAEKAMQPVTAGQRTIYPVNVMIGLLASWNGHYGNLVGYLRSKGIVPPSTARAQKKK